jgi:hypothetical protein
MYVNTMEILLLLALGSGSNDVVSFLNPAEYFQARNIPTTVDKMVELATAEPKDARTQIQQLLALRQLANQADEVKKAKNFDDILKKIEDVANGKKAQDLHGFAADYAGRAARALGAKVELAKVEVPRDSVRDDAVRWFPKDVSLVLSMDFRYPVADPAKASQAIQNLLYADMPPQIKEEFYRQVEQLGNFRVERFALALTENEDFRKQKIYIRISGKGDHKALVDAFRRMPAPIVPQIKEEKGFRGKKVTIIDMTAGPNGPAGGPVLAVIGNEDFIVAGYNSRTDGSSDEPMRQMLDVRRGKADSVLKGPLAGRLKKVAPTATGMFVGNLSERIREDFLQGPDTFRLFPKEVLVQMSRKATGMDLKLQTSLESAEKATKFVEDINRIKKLSLERLANPQPQPPGFPPVPPKLYDHLRDTVKSIKAEAKDREVAGTMTVPADLVNVGPTRTMGFYLGGGRTVKKVEKKDVFEEKIEEKPEKEIKKEIKKAPKDTKKESHLLRPGRPVAWQPAALRRLTFPPQVIRCRHEDAT